MKYFHLKYSNRRVTKQAAQLESSHSVRVLSQPAVQLESSHPVDSSTRVKSLFSYIQIIQHTVQLELSQQFSYNQGTQ